MRTGNFLRVLLVFAAATLCNAQMSDVLGPVAARYQGKIVALRSAARGGHLSYVANGPVAESDDAEWWQDALILCKSFKLKDRTVEVRADRLSFGFDPNAGKFATGRSGDLRIELRFDAPPDAAAVTSAFERIVHDPDTPIADVAPPYWQACLRGPSAKQVPLRRCWFQGVRGAEQPGELKSQQGGDVARQATVFVRIVDADGAPRYETESRLVYRVGPKVSQPKALYTPDPGYTDWARSRHAGGSCGLRMIINELGRVEDVQVIRPLGYGLDDVSALILQTWKFTPAMFEGRPVPVEVIVETDFKMYPSSVLPAERGLHP